MTTAQFAGYVLSDEPRMVNAVGVGGAAWEIWMQVEMAVVLHASGLQVAREVPYPAPSPLKLDALAGDAAGKYAIELKVESATSAGKAVLDGVVADRAKLAQYTNTVTRWAVGIAYGDTAKGAFTSYAATPANGATYFPGKTTGVLVCKV